MMKRMWFVMSVVFLVSGVARAEGGLHGLTGAAGSLGASGALSAPPAPSTPNLLQGKSPCDAVRPSNGPDEQRARALRAAGVAGAVGAGAAGAAMGGYGL